MLLDKLRSAADRVCSGLRRLVGSLGVGHLLGLGQTHHHTLDGGRRAQPVRMGLGLRFHDLTGQLLHCHDRTLAILGLSIGG